MRLGRRRAAGGARVGAVGRRRAPGCPRAAHPGRLGAGVAGARSAPARDQAHHRDPLHLDLVGHRDPPGAGQRRRALRAARRHVPGAAAVRVGRRGEHRRDRAGVPRAGEGGLAVPVPASGPGRGTGDLETAEVSRRPSPPVRDPAREKVYDRGYFERWYRDPRYTVVQRDVLRRRVRLAVAAAEYLLERPIRSVLDVGCGEGAWFPLLRRLRPRVRYVGVDSSEYAVRRFGKRRHLRLGSVGALARLGLRGPFDLVVCSDVLHYVGTPEARRGLKAIARLTRGVAFLELFAKEDQTEGDHAAFQQRPAAAYRRLFREAGMVPLGLHCYAAPGLAQQLTVFERGGPA
ncbi:MAG: class I SAM-dependent methyltransferase [Candidatus Eisenbacteria bacterium]|nr:class I SAM-dependent methyltransferase [Candidatus Eisenbacteria bacterium]